MAESFVAYDNLRTPNEVLEKMAEYVEDKGYTIIQPLIDDLNIYDRASVDGKKFVFLDKSNTYYINMRSCNGYNIFGLNNESEQDLVSMSDNADINYSGIGMTVSETWSNVSRWYNQYNVPIKYNDKDVLGVYMPVNLGTSGITPVPEPTPVQEPVVVPQPEPLVLPDAPEEPEEPVKEEYPDEPVLNSFIDLVKNTKVYVIDDSMSLKEIVNACGNTDSINSMSDLTAKYPLSSGNMVSIGGIKSWYSNYKQYGDESQYTARQTMLQSTIDMFENKSIIFFVDDQTHYYTFDNNIPDDTYYALLGPSGNRTLNQTCGITSYPSGTTVDSAVYTNSISWYPNNTNFDTTGNDQNSYGFYAAICPNANYIRNSSNQVVGYPYVLDNNAYAFFTSFNSMVQDEVDGFNNRTSQDWVDYYDEVNRIDSEYNNAMNQYLTDKAQYDLDKADYDAEVARRTSDYNTAVSNYNAYLAAKAIYDAYLAELDLYNDYLDLVDASAYRYTLYCNEVFDSDDQDISTLAFSLMKSNDDYKQVSHLIVGNLIKYDEWMGGIIFTGSANRYNMLDSVNLYEHDKTSDRHIYPVFSSGKYSNTFLRIDIDDAPSVARGQIHWASSGEDNITGKPLSLPIRTGSGNTVYGNGLIPHYYYLQSHDRLDSGRNINTLNCVTLNLPLYAAVRIDPDQLDNYAAAGEILGVYFISTYNIQTASVYEINYPMSNDTCQAFSVGKRRGNYGFDGISIKQMDEAEEISGGGGDGLEP